MGAFLTCFKSDDNEVARQNADISDDTKDIWYRIQKMLHGRQTYDLRSD